MSESFKPIARKVEKVPQQGEITYDLETGARIKLQFKEFSSDMDKNSEVDEEHIENTIIFLPGWEVGAQDSSTERIGKTFAKSSGSAAVAVTTVSEKTGTSNVKESSDMLYEEAIAVSKYIKEKQFKNITLVGYSVGGNKAIDIAHILQEDPDIEINGLVLLASVGIYEQSPRELTRNLLKDSFVKTPKRLVQQNPQGFKEWFQVATDVGAHLTMNMITSKGDIGKVRRGITEMARINPRIGEIKVPVVLISGSDDRVSDAEKLVPIEEGRASIQSRELYLKEHLFVQSPSVQMLVPEKMGNHGLPYFRAESVADTSLYLLKRFHRSNSDPVNKKV